MGYSSFERQFALMLASSILAYFEVVKTPPHLFCHCEVLMEKLDKIWLMPKS
jgi:hypothetical protein